MLRVGIRKKMVEDLTGFFTAGYFAKVLFICLFVSLKDIGQSPRF